MDERWSGEEGEVVDDVRLLVSVRDRLLWKGRGGGKKEEDIQGLDNE